MKIKAILALNHLWKSDYTKAAVFYLMLTCVVYSPVVFYGKTLSMSARYPWFKDNPPETETILPKTYPNTFNVDVASPAAYEEPVDAFIGNQLRRGIFPLWNPFIACGTIIQEQFGTRTLFPYQLLQNICPWQWRDFFLLGRLFLAAMGVFIFLRLRKISFYPSLCGGAMYGLSGAMTVFLTLTQMSNVGMMLPYAFIGTELLHLGYSICSAAFCSLTVALVILGGQPETAFYGLLFICAYYIFRVISSRNEKHIIKKFILFFVSIIVSFLIASPFFIPFLLNSNQYYSLHPPGGDQGIGGVTPLVNFVAIFIPELLRWRMPVHAMPFNYGWDRLGGYIGISCVFLIIASLRRHWWGRKDGFFFLGFALFVLLKNLGLPIVSWIGRLPIFDQVWTPRWAGPIWNLSLILCAAFGFQAYLSEGQEHGEQDNDCGLSKYKPWGWNPLMAIIIEVSVLSLFALFNIRFLGLLESLSRYLRVTLIVAWNWLLIMLAALGFLIIFLLRDNKSQKKSRFLSRSTMLKSPTQIIAGILVLSLGILINVTLWTIIKNGANVVANRLTDSTLVILRIFCITMTSVIVYYSVRRLAFPLLFIIFTVGITLCVFNFHVQAQQVRGDYYYWEHILNIRDWEVAFSLWWALIESVIFSFVLLIGIFLVWKRRFSDKTTSSLIISGIILTEISFHVTMGYNEVGRLLRLLLHTAVLFYLIKYTFSAELDTQRIRFKKMVSVLYGSMVLIGIVGFRCLPNRQDAFTLPYQNIKFTSFSRVMGIRGAVFPNSSAALEIQDVKGVVSLSIKRFQLFQDNCLLLLPQKRHKGLWLTGVPDSDKGRNILDSLRERHSFYSLVGVENYLSFGYEDIPYTKLVQDGKIKNYRNLVSMPRAFIVHRWSVANAPEEALRWMLNNSPSFDSEAVIEGANTLPVSYLQEKSFAAAKIKSYNLHSIEIETETYRPGLLILTDTYHPDWKVIVDGKNENTFPVDLCFRGVFLKQGKHQVKFIYFPKAFYTCIAISFITLLTILLLVLKELLKNYYRISKGK